MRYLLPGWEHLVAEYTGPTKACTRCGQHLSVEAFHRNRSRVDGYARTCRTCTSEARRITSAFRRSDAYAETYAAQDGRCAVCGGRDELHVDHDHATGEVRGLLCTRCNNGLGMYRDDPRRLGRAIRYLVGPPVSLAGLALGGLRCAR